MVENVAHFHAARRLYGKKLGVSGAYAYDVKFSFSHVMFLFYVQSTSATSKKFFLKGFFFPMISSMGVMVTFSS